MAGLPTNPGGAGEMSMSVAVSTATTPCAAAARDVSIPRMRAWATGERT